MYSVTGNVKCINIQPTLMGGYLSRYRDFIMTEKRSTFQDMKWDSVLRQW